MPAGLTHTERAILAALRELETAAKSRPAPGTKPDFAALFARLDALKAALPRETHPDLLHYLHRKSYEKARLWLEGRGDENAPGTCRH